MRDKIGIFQMIRGSSRMRTCLRALGARVIIIYSGNGEKFTLGGETEIELAGWLIGANHKDHGNHVGELKFYSDSNGSGKLRAIIFKMWV